jgi:glycosyltransferase involved in cell wall biosynthesis
LHIAFLIPAFLPARDYGGPLTQMIHTAEEFIRLGHKVTVYTSNASSLTKFNQGLKPVEEIKGMTIKRFPIIASLKGFWITPSMYNQMMKDDFDVMHSWCLRCFQSEVAALVSFRTGKPLFINSGGSMGSYQSPTTTKSQKILHYLHNPMDMLVMKIAKKLIAVNKFEREIFKKYKNSDEKIIEIPVGFDPKEFQKNEINVRKELKIDSNEIILLSVCRLNKIKGLDTLVEAFTILNQKYEIKEKIKLIIIGKDDNYADILKNLIKKNQYRDNIILLEDQSREFIVSSYHTCDFFLIPSHYETGPCTILEAFVCKKPVIGSNVGGIPEMIKSGKNGIVVERADSEKLAKEMFFLIKNKNIRKEFGDEGFNEIQKYDILKIAQDLLNLYSNNKKSLK